MNEQKRLRKVRIKAANAAMAAGAGRRRAKIIGKIAEHEERSKWA